MLLFAAGLERLVFLILGVFIVYLAVFYLFLPYFGVLRRISPVGYVGVTLFAALSRLREMAFQVISASTLRRVM